MVSIVSLYLFSNGDIAIEGIEKYGSAHMKGPQELRIAHIGTGVCFHVEPMLCWFSAFFPEIPIVVMTPAKQSSTPKFGRP